MATPFTTTNTDMLNLTMALVLQLIGVWLVFLIIQPFAAQGCNVEIWAYKYSAKPKLGKIFFWGGGGEFLEVQYYNLVMIPVKFV